MTAATDPGPAPLQPPVASAEASPLPATARRQRTLLLPDIDWVSIAGGEFVYQQRERGKLPAFRIAR